MNAPCAALFGLTLGAGFMLCAVCWPVSLHAGPVALGLVLALIGTRFARLLVK